MEWYDKLQAYIQANTPRNTRPAVSPAAVMDQGLLGGRVSQVPQRAEEMYQGLLRVPADLKALGSPEMNQRVQDVYKNPNPQGVERDKLMGMAMDYLQTTSPVGGVAGMFIGKGAKTWDVLKAQQAEDMLKKGMDPREVWKQTGTFRGVDGALRQEIPDNAAKYDPEALAELKAWPEFNYRSDTQPLGGVIEHKKLFSAYPDADDIQVHFMPKQNLNEAFGSYSNKHDRITLADIGGDQTSPALHEIQHAIQQREGWSTGSSPKQLAQRYQQAQDEYDLMFQTMKANPERAKEIRPILDSLRNEYRDLTNPQEAYRRLAGEAEARLTQSRMNMTMPERLQSYPYDMLDVPQDQLIIRGLLSQ